MSLDLFILTPLINLEDRELCYFPNMPDFFLCYAHQNINKRKQISSKFELILVKFKVYDKLGSIAIVHDNGI